MRHIPLEKMSIAAITILTAKARGHVLDRTLGADDCQLTTEQLILSLLTNADVSVVRYSYAFHGPCGKEYNAGTKMDRRAFGVFVHLHCSPTERTADKGG